MRKCVFILIVGIVESGFKGPFLTQVSLFHQPHALLSHKLFFCTNDFQLDLQYELLALEFGCACSRPL